MGNVVIIHFSPPELYPPLQNLLRVLAEENRHTIWVFSTRQAEEIIPEYKPAEGIKLVRLGKSGSGLSSIRRLKYYLQFYLGCSWYLLKLMPGKLLYFETLSALPAYWYKRLINQKAVILVHYHEYTSPGEYKTGMKLTRWFHRLEKKLLPFASWVSHTNAKRLALFCADLSPVQLPHPRVMPNYPLDSWKCEARQHRELPYRLVYVGALSMDTMYTRDVGEWVRSQEGRITWTIFSNNITAAARQYLLTLPQDQVDLRQGKDYNSLKNLLPQFDAGLVLYKGHNENYTWNAPNKLFEYLVCGLDVWFPVVMEGIHPYQSAEAWPKVLPLEFDKLAQYDVNCLLERKPDKQRSINFTCEEATQSIVALLD